MTESAEVDVQIIHDAIEYKYLVRICSGCKKPYSERDAEALGVQYRDCGCPTGTSLMWNPRLILKEV